MTDNGRAVMRAAQMVRMKVALKVEMKVVLMDVKTVEKMAALMDGH